MFYLVLHYKVGHITVGDNSLYYFWAHSELLQFLVIYLLQIIYSSILLHFELLQILVFSQIVTAGGAHLPRPMGSQDTRKTMDALNALWSHYAPCRIKYLLSFYYSFQFWHLLFSSGFLWCIKNGSSIPHCNRNSSPFALATRTF